ncbi:ribosome biogenesis protein NOP53 [Aristolochia californica]|uniref:ribosome biogenesis protein NOP53 n=1 Tax=Aristolochia californica TaxID=171875 RepID=UPI0035DB3388
MGKKAKTSRKGKKAWRANIRTDDIEKFFERSTKDALSGGSLDAVPSDSLFYVDKTRDFTIKRKIEKHREKVLRCDSVLQRNSYIQPIPFTTVKKSKKKQKQVKKVISETEDTPKEEQNLIPALADIWKDGEDVKTKKNTKKTQIPAVEVEPSGCSFNPSFEAHQDSLAQAVANEMHKIYKNELGPQPVPLTVPGELVGEEEIYFLDADNGDDDSDDAEDLLEKGETGQRPSKRKQVTRVELNRRARRKEQQKVEEEENKTKNVSKEIDSLPDILNEIAQEDEQKKKRHLRRVLAREERLKHAPPRLGKHKFEPAPVQVLLSEEISGSLRKLKGCCTLARDRYKSLQKRGFLVPEAKRRRV